MNIHCPFCDTLHQHDECVSSSTVNRLKFEACCQHGKICLHPLWEPPLVLQSLFVDDSHEAHEFCTNIVQYNSALAFTSLGVKVNHSVEGLQYFEFTESWHIYVDLYSLKLHKICHIHSSIFMIPIPHTITMFHKIPISPFILWHPFNMCCMNITYTLLSIDMCYDFSGLFLLFTCINLMLHEVALCHLFLLWPCTYHVLNMLEPHVHTCVYHMVYSYI